MKTKLEINITSIHSYNLGRLVGKIHQLINREIADVHIKIREVPQ